MNNNIFFKSSVLDFDWLKCEITKHARDGDETETFGKNEHGILDTLINLLCRRHTIFLLLFSLVPGRPRFFFPSYFDQGREDLLIDDIGPDGVLFYVCLIICIKNNIICLVISF